MVLYMKFYIGSPNFITCDSLSRFDLAHMLSKLLIIGCYALLCTGKNQKLCKHTHIYSRVHSFKNGFLFGFTECARKKLLLHTG